MIDGPITPRRPDPPFDPLSNARRIIANPEIILSSGEWRKVVSELVAWIEKTEYDEIVSDERSND